MPERPSGKPRKRAGKPAAAAAAGRQPAPGLAERVRTLEAERDRLIAELEAARARISDLERSREQVLNRIDWVIDSLHTLIEK